MKRERSEHKAGVALVWIPKGILFSFIEACASTTDPQPQSGTTVPAMKRERSEHKVGVARVLFLYVSVRFDHCPQPQSGTIVPAVKRERSEHKVGVAAAMAYF